MTPPKDEPMPRLIVNLTSYELPKEPRGRYTRFVIDVDADAVQRYIYESIDRNEPWPVAVVQEMISALQEWAQLESAVAAFADRRMSRLTT